MRETPSSFVPVEASARQLFDRAIDHCRHRTGTTREATLERLRVGDVEQHATLRYALAKELGRYLGGLGVSFLAIYVYGSAMTESSSPCSDIDVIVVVDRHRDEVDRLLRGLDLAFVAYFRELSPRSSAMSSLLDVHVVEQDPSDGAPPGGPFTRPICLWRLSDALSREGSRPVSSASIGAP